VFYAEEWIALAAVAGDANGERHQAAGAVVTAATGASHQLLAAGVCFVLFVVHLLALGALPQLVDARHAAFKGAVFIVVYLSTFAALPEWFGIELLHGFLQGE
jgi:hypothetical protein